MENIFNDMKALYSARHIRAIDPFMKKWIASDCVVMGTALGELSRSYNEVHALFDADLRYWYDLELFPERATRVAIGDYAYCTCPAESSYSILENDSRYNGYMSWCDDIIADATVSPTRRAAEIAFILDTLLSSRKNTRRKNRLPLTVRLIIRGEKAVFISFAYNKTMDTADHYMGDGANTAEAYARERSALDGRCAGGMAALIESQGFEDATVSRANGDSTALPSCQGLTRKMRPWPSSFPATSRRMHIGRCSICGSRSRICRRYTRLGSIPARWCASSALSEMGVFLFSCPCSRRITTWSGIKAGALPASEPLVTCTAPAVVPGDVNNRRTELNPLDF